MTIKDLSVNDLRALNESVLILNSDSRRGSYAERLSSALASLIPSDLAAVECFDNSGSWCKRLLGDANGVIEKHFEAFMRLGTTHPLFPAFVAGKLQWNALRISDVISQKCLYNLDLYHQFLRPIGVNVQMGVSIALSDGSAEVLILSRKDIDYTISERNRLSAFLPHILNARRHAAQHASDRYVGPPTDCNSTEKSIQTTYLQQRIGLTRRESEIVWSLTQGLCDKDIASTFEISQRTVQKHCENIYRKCGVANRTAMVIAALSNDR